MTRRALFRESSTGALDDGAGGVVHGVPDPSGEPDGKVLETSSGALVYGTGGTGGGDVAGDTHAASSKATPVDADEIPLVDSAASFALKKLTWANLKATAKAYFDTLYPSGSGTSTGTNTGDQTTVSGNAGTATKLATARNIDGQAFDGLADITVIAPGSHAATSKPAPVDADEIPLVDSAASNVLKKLTWANLKATVKAYTDTLYPSGSGTSSGTNTGDQTTVSGNAGTATALQTGRTIDGQTFDGTANITVIAPGTHAATSKATPVDADELALVDSAASNVLKKLTWANLKATLKTYFDTLYQPVGTGGAPSGSAGGDLGGTYPNPTVAALHETTGPTKLTLGSVPDGNYLVRSGSTIIGGSPTPGGPPTGAAGGALAGTYPNPSLAGKTIDGQTFDGNSNITVIAPGTHGATGKTTPVDADELALVDSAASNVLKKLTWANLKATLKTYFDTLYQASGASAGGDLTGTYPNPTLGTAGPGATGPIGSATVVPIITIDAKGRVTALTSAAIDVAGESRLVYRYTVTGSDKASIDTGVDTPDAGSNDWTNGDLLEVFIFSRTDEAVAVSVINVTVNNLGTSIYDIGSIQDTNATVAGSNVLAAAAWALSTTGASATLAAAFGTNSLVFPNYAGTVANKAGSASGSVMDSTAANVRVNQRELHLRSTTAITRLAVAPATAAKKLKVGSQLLIYKRLAS